MGISKGKKIQAKAEAKPPEDEKRLEKEEEVKLTGTAWGKSGEQVRKAQAEKRAEDIKLKKKSDEEEAAKKAADAARKKLEQAAALKKAQELTKKREEEEARRIEE